MCHVVAAMAKSMEVGVDHELLHPVATVKGDDSSLSNTLYPMKPSSVLTMIAFINSRLDIIIC